MLCNLDERRLGKDGNVKIRCHKGGTIADMFEHVNTILRRKPTFIILHVGTNNSVDQDASTIVNNLIKLKQYIETYSGGCKVIISSLLMRNDYRKANYTINKVNTMLRELNLVLVDNDNIEDMHLGSKGLHLNRRGIGRFALNLISHIWCL